MKTVGIICEYNPFHLGHAKQFRIIREQHGGDCRIVCLMSGNYVQRGETAIISKFKRAEMAIKCGADLVVEMPLPYSVATANRFAFGGVNVLQYFCDNLIFGSESGSVRKV